jgi:hypothetical protein
VQNENRLTLVVSSAVIVLQAQPDGDPTLHRVRFYRWDAEKLAYVEIAEVREAPFQTTLRVSDLNVNKDNQIFVMAFDTAGQRSAVTPRILIRVLPSPPQYFLFLPWLANGGG